MTGSSGSHEDIPYLSGHADGGGDAGERPTLDTPTPTTEEGQHGVVTDGIAVDFETADADQAFTGQHEGPFLRVMAYTDAGGDTHTTSDPVQMREILVSAPRLITSNGWAFDLAAAAHHLGLEVEELIAKSEDVEVAARLEHPPRATDGAARDR